MRPLALHIGPHRYALRTSGRFLGKSSGCPWDVMKSVSNTEADLKKSVAHKKRGYYVGCYDSSTRHRPLAIHLSEGSQKFFF